MDSHWLSAGLVYFDKLISNKHKGSIQGYLVLCVSPDDFNRFSIHSGFFFFFKLGPVKNLRQN